MNQEFEIGIIKWFNQEKKFGVIGAPDDEDYFLYYTNAIDPQTAFKNTMLVHFQKGYDVEREKQMAYKVRPFNIDDYDMLAPLLDKKSIVKGIQFPDVIKSSRTVKIQSKRERGGGNIFNQAIKWIFSNHSDDEIIKFIADSIQCAKEINAELTARFCLELIKLLKKTSLFKKDLVLLIYQTIHSNINPKASTLLWKHGFYNKEVTESGIRERRTSFIKFLPNKRTLPFNEKWLITYADILSGKDISKLGKYEIDNEILLSIIEEKYQKGDISEDELNELVEIFSTFDHLSGDIFGRLKSKFTDELIFKAWMGGKVQIDFTSKIGRAHV